MKLMVLTDIEGATGVTTYGQAEDRVFGQRMLLNDLVALIDGILSQGQHEIVVYDEHTDGRNIPMDDLPEQVSVVCGKPLVGRYWRGIDQTYDGLIMLGAHARAGVAGALLPHSYSRKNQNIWINDVLVGEIGNEAAIAGDNGVPLIMVTGDSAGVTEACEMVPGVRTATVKEALGECEALCYPPKVTYKRIFDTASQVVANPARIEPLRVQAPVELRIEIRESDYLDNLRRLHEELFMASNMVGIRGNSAIEVWMQYLCVEREVKTR